jgi:VWFA-related protein
MKGSVVGQLAWSLGVICTATWPFAQAVRSAGVQDQQVLRVTTHLVEVHVVVHDKQGAPVEGLTRGDFTVVDNGKEEQISVFSVESNRRMQEPIEPLPPNIFSNRVARQGGIPTNVAVILLDGLDTTFWDLAYARRQLIKLLTQLQPQDRVALYFLGRQLSVVQDFTGDPSPLLEALRRYRPQTAAQLASNVQTPAMQDRFEGLSGLAAVAATQLDAGMTVLMLMDESVRQYSAERVLDALLAIAEHLSGLPGRKSLVWIAGEIYLPLQDNPHLSDKRRRLILTLNHADVAIYPIDARGLFIDPDFHAEDHDFAHFDRGEHGRALDAMNFAIFAANYIARETGGRAFYNTNDLRTAMRTALGDSEVTYTLGYYPSHAKWDGEFRPIKVLVNRKDVEVRHRHGYYARTALPVENADPIALLKDAAENPLDATGIGLTVRARPRDGAADQVEIAVNVDARDLTFQPVKGLWTVRFDTWVGQYSNKGASLEGVSKTTSADLKEETYLKILREGGVSLTFEERIKPGAQELRVAVRDAASGSVGSVRIPLADLH